MYPRVKHGGSPAAPHDYLQIVEGYREGSRVKQRVVANLGRLDKLILDGSLDGLLKGLGRFSEQLKVIERARLPEVAKCQAKLWGPVLVFRRLWEEQGLPGILGALAAKRHFRFDVERVCFALALQRLIEPGSDLQGSSWMSRVVSLEAIELQQLYRTCTFLAENKERIERELFLRERTLFDSSVDLVFFDTTSTYFEGRSSLLKRYGFSKDHRPDRVQVVVGVVLSRDGWPLACEVMPGNQADVKAVAGLIRLLKGRFQLGRVILVADRGFVSSENLGALAQAELEYIVGAGLRQCREIREEVLKRADGYEKVSDNLQVREVVIEDRRYVVCLNPAEAVRDAAERAALLAALAKRLAAGGPKSLLGNRGYARYLKVARESVAIDPDKVESDAQFDGKYVLQTNTTLGAVETAQAYRSLWQIERAFRELKSTLAVRPVFHRRDVNIIGHVFGAFLALRLEVALQKKLAAKGWKLSWPSLLGDLAALKAVQITLDGRSYTIRTELAGDCYKGFQAVGLRPPGRVQLVDSPEMLCH
jgi:hypothetical protein